MTSLILILAAAYSWPVNAEEVTTGTEIKPCSQILESPADYFEELPSFPGYRPGGGAPVPGVAAGAKDSAQPGTPETSAGSSAGSTRGGLGSGFVQNVQSNAGAGAANSVLTLQNAMVLSQMARGNETAEESAAKTAQFKASEANDRSVLEREYQNVSYSELDSRMKRAERELSNFSKYLDSDRPADLSPADQAFYRNTFANAADKAEIAQTLLHETKNKDKVYSREEVRRLLDQARQEQNSLIDRLLMLNGLEDRERQETLSKLNLAEQVKIVLPNGQTRKIPLLHNGYLNAAGRSELDCPTFIAATLSPKFRKANLTTIDLRGIWALSRTGYLPQGVKWAEGRQEMLKKVSKGFEAVDVYLGEKPEPGDLLVHRVLADTHGRVAVVKSYDPKNLVAHVAEPSADGTRLVEYDFPLSTEPSDKAFRDLRPGLATLRLLPDQNSACNSGNGKKAAPLKGGR